MNESNEAVLRHETNPPCYQFLFWKQVGEEYKVYFWNAILGIREAGHWFASEVSE